MTTVDQKKYLLDKYLKPVSGAKKKKTKKRIKGTGVKVIDDDVDTSQLRTLDPEELEALGLDDEEAPQVAGIIDERPEHLREMDRFKQSKWRVIAQTDGIEKRLRVEEIERDEKKVEEENTAIFGKMYSDSEEEKKNDSDLSPPRQKQKRKISQKRKNIRGSDSDLSPPRIGKREKEDSDQSPPKRRERSRDSDLSPPRRNEEKKKEKPRKASRWGNFPPEQNADKDKEAKPYQSKSGSNTRMSPSRKRQDSPKRDRRKSYDSDLSPPRKSRKESPKRRDRRKSSDSDLSPPRTFRNELSKRKDRRSADSDLSPPRRKTSKLPSNKPFNRQSPPNRRQSIDSDLSPPRKIEKERYQAEKRGTERNKRWNDDSPPPSNRKMEKTLDGKMAGLQNATNLNREVQEYRRREDELYTNMSADVSGRNAKTVSRKKRATSAEKEREAEKRLRAKEMEEKYNKWGKGLKQISDQERRRADYEREAAKPFARARDDADMERALRAADRDGDPMLDYLRENKPHVEERPTYKGNWPPNRFNIRPGYRWDGVDRTNGYEKKLFDSRSKARALEEEAYKWSTEDL